MKSNGIGLAVVGGSKLTVVFRSSNSNHHQRLIRLQVNKAEFICRNSSSLLNRSSNNQFEHQLGTEKTLSFKISMNRTFGVPQVLDSNRSSLWSVNRRRGLELDQLSAYRLTLCSKHFMGIREGLPSHSDCRLL